MEINKQLSGLSRCPHCSVSNPNMEIVWHSNQSRSNTASYKRADGGIDFVWAAFSCVGCRGVIAVQGNPYDSHFQNRVLQIFPSPKAVEKDLPESARRYLQQAFNTLHAPDAAAVVAASAVDAMLKELGYKTGSLYSRIDQAVKDNILTANMAEWAHHVRLEANRTRHADEDEPHVTSEQAKQVVDFAEALGQFLFVLPSKMSKSLGQT